MMSEKARYRGRLVLKAVAPDDAAFVSALEEAQLLTSGLAGKGCANFSFVNKKREVVAFGGYTVFDRIALMRSFVVLPEYRGLGVGARFATALISQLQGMNISRVFLLTEGAEFFFASLGFAALAREQAPRPIRETEQFIRHCSDEAVFMTRPLDEMMRLSLDDIHPVVRKPE
ncbi:MAG TPA: GNAT family N-acetyltransferase [Rhizobiales bacterium]|nr:GNAT family N-acetyltransferase [Hyphomicrobiales bacterium]